MSDKPTIDEKTHRLLRTRLAEKQYATVMAALKADSYLELLATHPLCLKSLLGVTKSGQRVGGGINRLRQIGLHEIVAYLTDLVEQRRPWQQRNPRKRQKRKGKLLALEDFVTETNDDIRAARELLADMRNMPLSNE